MIGKHYRRRAGIITLVVFIAVLLIGQSIPLAYAGDLESNQTQNAEQKEDISSYSKKIFGMYGGTLEKVTLEFKESLIGAIVDRFGKDIIIHKKDDFYQTSVEVMCSSHFLGWIFSLGSDIEILAPQNVRDLYVEKVEVLLKKYR